MRKFLLAVTLIIYLASAAFSGKPQTTCSGCYGACAFVRDAAKSACLALGGNETECERQAACAMANCGVSNCSPCLWIALEGEVCNQ
jgi:hypothetical protein